MKREAEIGVTYLQGKACQGLSRATRSQKRQRKFFPGDFGGDMALPLKQDREKFGENPDY